MRAHSPGWASDDTENERESRIRLALLRGVLENLHRNQLVTPVLALAICAIFSQWVGPVLLAA
jgi:hypothetical protein